MKSIFMIVIGLTASSATARDFDDLKAAAEAHQSSAPAALDREVRETSQRQRDTAEFNRAYLGAALKVALNHYGKPITFTPSFRENEAVSGIEFFTTKKWHCRSQGLVFLDCYNEETFDKLPGIINGWN